MFQALHAHAAMDWLMLYTKVENYIYEISSKDHYKNRDTECLQN